MEKKRDSTFPLENAMQGALLAYKLIGPIQMVEAYTTVGFRQRGLWRVVADSRGERLGRGAIAECGEQLAMDAAA